MTPKHSSANRVEDAWIGAVEFAALSNISRQKAHRALARAWNDGRPWRSHTLLVRRVKGQGGKSGQQYQVRVDSLPIALQEQWRENPFSDDRPVSEIDTSNPATQWRLEIIQPIFKYASGTTERAAAIDEAAKIIREHPTSGRRRRIAARTLRSWLSDYDRDGLAGLKPHRRSDRGKRRAVLTRRWDAAVPFDEATKEKISAEIKTLIHAMWRDSDTIGWKTIARDAQTQLIKKTMATGFNPGLGQLRRICKLSRSIIEEQRQGRQVGVHDKNRKKYSDQQPRILRTIDGLRPLEVVVADTHDLDIYLPRPEGGIYTPKLIGFLDLATRRIFHHLLFPELGTKVRGEHFVEAFASMCEHPCWGVPENFYQDHGAEYYSAALMDDAMQLNTGARQMRLLLTEKVTDEFPPRRHSSIIKAKPYNAAAKQIEQAFNILERSYFSILPGYVGGDRMKKRTHNEGEAPIPYSDGTERFRETIAMLIDLYNQTPQDGGLRGRSPVQAFNEFVDGGWKCQPMLRNDVYAAFCKEEIRVVKQGSFRLEAAYYTHPNLRGVEPGTRIIVRVPIVPYRERLRVLNSDRSFLCIAETDKAFATLDPAGARESAKRQREHRAAIERLRGDTPPTDFLDLNRQTIELGDVPKIPQSLEPIRLDQSLTQGEYEMGITPDEKEARDDARKKRQRKEKADNLDALVKAIRAAG